MSWTSEKMHEVADGLTDGQIKWTRKTCGEVIRNMAERVEDLEAQLTQARDSALEEAARVFEAKFKCTDHAQDDAVARGLICARNLHTATEVLALKSKPGDRPE